MLAVVLEVSAPYEPTPIIERAIEIAQSGKCNSLVDLRRQLSPEGYSSVDQHLAGSSIGKQIKGMIHKAQHG
ncbi:hypothetical protein [Sphingomonas sp. PB4P5]|uniref:hypothetical protein n=1 Tax=Parasphingomonas puruogangriensis TaxID=3096155 RepID=UPI002FC9C98C